MPPVMDNGAMQIDTATSVMEDSSSSLKTTVLKIEDVTRVVSYIVRGVELDQTRLIARAIRMTSTIRKNIRPSMLRKVVGRLVPTSNPFFDSLSAALDKLESVAPVDEEDEEGAAGSGDNATTVPNGSMDVDAAAAEEEHDVVAAPTAVTPEVEVYLFNLVLTGLLRHNAKADAVACASTMMARVMTFNRRTLDLLNSKFFFYFSLCFEKAAGEVPGIELSSARPDLLTMYRRCCVRHDQMGQAVLLNLLMRNYLHYNLYDQAYTLASKAPFPESASNNQNCRFLYYMGRIAAVQLEYGDAHMKLMQAARKAPTDTSATAFVAEVTQLGVIVQLLMGDIPPASTFRSPEYAAALAPYEELTLAVKNGDLSVFAQVATKHADLFKSAKNYSLVQRLQHNVLKTGLRKISISYARISIADVASKLRIESHSTMEFICAKAIRDGVIQATIDHENGWLVNSEGQDMYESEQPQEAFHRRIAFCMEVHNEAVKSMRYPPDAYKRDKKDSSKDVDSVEKSIEELIQEMEDDEMDEM